MGKKSRRKGSVNERALAKLLGGHRVPLSGAQTGYPGDVIDHKGRRWECKVREGTRSGMGLIYRWLGDNFGLAMRTDHNEWLVVLRVKDWASIDGAPPPDALGVESPPDAT